VDKNTLNQLYWAWQPLDDADDLVLIETGSIGEMHVYYYVYRND